MPSHPERVRTASLPEGYRFGDARPAVRYGLPLCPILQGTPDRVLYVELADTKDDTIRKGLSELNSALHGGAFTAYAQLEAPRFADTRYFGPARLVSIYNPFPPDGAPRVVHLLHLGLIGWHVMDAKPFTTDRDPGDETKPLLVEKCTAHGREREADCAECQTLPRLSSAPTRRLRRREA